MGEKTLNLRMKILIGFLGLGSAIKFDASQVQGFFSLIETKYSKINHHQAMMDFKQDGNGLFKSYFDYCDKGQDGILTPQDDATCQAKVESHMASMFGSFDKSMMASSRPTLEKIFEQFIDKNHDGKTTLAELRMGGYCVLRIMSEIGIELLDSNGNGRLDKREFGGWKGLDDLIQGSVKGYLDQMPPAIRRKVEKYTSRQMLKLAFKSADLNDDNSWDARELTKLVLTIGKFIVDQLF